MTLRSFFVLAVLTALAVTGAAWSLTTGNTSSAIAERGRTLLPGIVEKSNDIGSVLVETGDGTMTLTREGSGFIDESGLTVKTEALRNLIASLALMTVEETKTADTDRYGDLDLADPNAEDGAGERVVLLDTNGDAVVDLVAGKTDSTVGGTRGGQFVRTAGDPVAYLVRGAAALPIDRAGWFDTGLVTLSEGDIDTVRFETDGEIVGMLVREGSDLTVKDPPFGRESDAGPIGRVSRIFQDLDFIDVRKSRDGVAVSPDSVTATTKDGVSVTIRELEDGDDGEAWVRIEAEGPEAAHEGLVGTLNEKVSGRDFRLGRNDSGILGWTAENLTKALGS